MPPFLKKEKNSMAMIVRTYNL